MHEARPDVSRVLEMNGYLTRRRVQMSPIDQGERLRRRQTMPLYPNHRPSPWLTDYAAAA
jgi:hypothetical protein